MSEKVLHLTREEVPHAIAVVIEKIERHSRAMDQVPDHPERFIIAEVILRASRTQC